MRKQFPTQCYKKKLSSISYATQVTWTSWLCEKKTRYLDIFGTRKLILCTFVDGLESYTENKLINIGTLISRFQALFSMHTTSGFLDASSPVNWNKGNKVLLINYWDPENQLFIVQHGFIIENSAGYEMLFVNKHFKHCVIHFYEWNHGR